MTEAILLSFVLTAAFELCLSFVLGVRSKTDYIVLICANACTNPVVVFIAALYKSYGFAAFPFVVAFLEAAAVFVEGFAYKSCLDYNRINPYLFSFVNNAFSFGMGLIISYIIKGAIL